MLDFRPFSDSEFSFRFRCVLLKIVNNTAVLSIIQLHGVPVAAD